VLVTFPGEPFTEIGLRLKQRSPFPNTFVAGYSNGWIGYAPTADCYDKGTYEDSLTPLAPEWEQLYDSKALELIRGLGPDAHGQPGTAHSGGQATSAELGGSLRERWRPRRQVDVDGVLTPPDLDHLAVFEVQEHLVPALEQFLTNDHDRVLPRERPDRVAAVLADRGVLRRRAAAVGV
jgi:hypothetical protein